MHYKSKEITHLVSAVVINHNGANYTIELLHSLLDSEYPLDEIIVIDDRSTDDSMSRIRELFPHVKVHSTQNNIGPGGARNAGMALAKNDLIVFLDNDVEIKSDAIQKLVKGIQSNPGYTFYVPRVLYFDDKEVVQKEGTDIHYLGLTLNVATHNLHKDTLDATPRELIAFPGVCFLYAKKHTNNIAKYDESYFYTFEDLDFSVHNHIIGNKSILLPVAEVYHKGGTPGLSYRGGSKYPNKRLEFLVKNRWMFCLKYYQRKTLILFLPASFAFDVGIILFATFRNGLSGLVSVARGYRSLICALSKILSNRKEIQGHRILADKEYLFNRKLRFNKCFQNGFTGVVISIVDSCLRTYGRFILGLKSK